MPSNWLITPLKSNMKSPILAVMLISLVMTACEKKPVIVVPTDQQLLINAIRIKNFDRVDGYLKTIRLTENSQNLIRFYMRLYSENLLTLNHSINYLEQFYSNMSFVQQSVFNQMAIWVYFNRIYRHEISPPVRILQRQELLLAPSEIDFGLCVDNEEVSHCAIVERRKLLTFMSNQQIASTLKKMALKDPCVNLSNKPQGQKIANRCLQKSTGELKVSLLPVPFFTYNEWFQILNNK